MMRICLILAVLACSACSRPATPPVEMARSTPTPPAAEPAAVTETFSFMTQTDDVPADPRILRTVDGPCGPVVDARVATMPLNDPVLLADLVVEFQPDGTELQHWRKPSDVEMVGLDGPQLLFAAGDAMYWTTADGRFGSVVADDPRINPELLGESMMFECPALPSFAESGYAQCFRMTDAAGVQRLIAMEGVCS